MGYESYTIEQLVSYYQETIGWLEDFNINNIYIVDNLQTVTDKYHINESVNNINGFTIPLDGCVVAIFNNLNEFDSIVTLFHELTHVRDFIWFSKKYKITDLYKNRLYYALQMYSEINAHYYGNKLAIDFLGFTTPEKKQLVYQMIMSKDDLMGSLRKKDVPVSDIFRDVGYLLLFEYLNPTGDYLSHAKGYVHPIMCEKMNLILDAYFDCNIEEINSIIFQYFLQ